MLFEMWVLLLVKFILGFVSDLGCVDFGVCV